jgi:hypothetical protein
VGTQEERTIGFRTQRIFSALLLSGALTLGGTAGAAAQQQQTGLVNVQVGDITTGDILSNNNVSVGAAANIAATVCGLTAQVGVISKQIARTGQFSCDGATQFARVTSTP